MAEHGTTTRYRDGCRCQPCKDANTAKSRRAKANYRTTDKTEDSNVVEMPNTKPSAAKQNRSRRNAGMNEVAVREAFNSHDPNGDFAIQREQAICMAQILDDPERMHLWAQSSRQLDAVCKVLQPRKRKHGNRLAAVSAMSRMDRRQAR